VARIIETWGAVVGSVEVVAGTGGIFDVDLDGEQVFTKSMIGRYPEPEDVMPLLQEQISP
jgi:predicted Rdx family selenoprotein